MDKLHAMQVLIQTVDSGSFSAAAEVLSMTPQNVARTIAALEKQLGTRLLQRSTRTQVLTEAGRLYLEESRRIVEAMQEAEAQVQNLQVLPSGMLRVASQSTFGIYALSSRLPRWLAQNPDVSVELSVTGRRVDLLAEGFDVVIQDEPLADGSLICRRICSIPIVLAASPTYLARYGRPVTPEDLHRHVLLHRPDQKVWYFRSPEGGMVSVQTDGRYVSDNCQFSAEMALQGMGITKQPKYRLKKELDAGLLVEVLTDWPVPDKSLNVIFAERRFAPLKVRAFIDFLVKEFEHGM